MALLKVFLFGRVRIEHDGLPAVVDPTRTVAALLAYLALNRRPQRRESLLAALWMDLPEDRGRRCLNTALWRLRKLLEPPGIQRGTYLVISPQGGIELNTEGDCWLDVTTFERRLGELLAKPAEELTDADICTWHNVLRLHSSELLDGYDDPWALVERDRLLQLYLAGLSALMLVHRLREEYEPALALGHQAVAIDPLREDVHRELMRIFLQTGQRAMVVRQYEACRDLFDAELGVHPAATTEALYRQALSTAVAARHPEPRAVATDAAAVARAFESLRWATQALVEVGHRLDEVIALLHSMGLGPVRPAGSNTSCRL